MNWFVSLFFKITTLILFISYNAFAGGLEVSRQNNMILFSDGTTVNFSSRQTSSTVTDNLYTSLDSQSIIKKLNIMSAAFKSDYSDTISYAFEMYEPMASTLQYPATIGGVPAGQKALLRSQALSLTGKYDLTNSGFGIVGGIRQLTIKRSTVNISPAQGDLVTTPDSGIGYMAGVSYERPEIALKVLLFALTIFCGIMIRISAKPYILAFSRMVEEGSSPEIEKEINQSAARARRWVKAIWLLISLAAFIGIWKPLI